MKHRLLLWATRKTQELFVATWYFVISFIKALLAFACTLTQLDFACMHARAADLLPNPKVFGCPRAQVRRDLRTPHLLLSFHCHHKTPTCVPQTGSGYTH